MTTIKSSPKFTTLALRFSVYKWTKIKIHQIINTYQMKKYFEKIMTKHKEHPPMQVQ